MVQLDEESDRNLERLLDVLLKVDDFHLNEHVDDTALAKLSDNLPQSRFVSLPLLSQFFTRALQIEDISKKSKLFCFILSLLPRFLEKFTNLRVPADQIFGKCLVDRNCPHIKCALLDSTRQMLPIRLDHFQDILDMAFQSLREESKESLFVKKCSEKLILGVVVDGECSYDMKNRVFDSYLQLIGAEKSYRLVSDLLPIIDRLSGDQVDRLYEFTGRIIEDTRAGGLQGVHELVPLWRMYGASAARCEADGFADFLLNFDGYKPGIIACCAYALSSQCVSAGGDFHYFTKIFDVLKLMAEKEFLMCNSDLKILIAAIDSEERAQTMAAVLVDIFDKFMKKTTKMVIFDCLVLVAQQLQAICPNTPFQQKQLAWCIKHSLVGPWDCPKLLEAIIMNLDGSSEELLISNSDFPSIANGMCENIEWETKDNALEVLLTILKSAFKGLPQTRSLVQTFPISRIPSESSHFIRYSMLRVLNSICNHCNGLYDAVIDGTVVLQCVQSIIENDSDPLPRREAMRLILDRLERSSGKDLSLVELIKNEIVEHAVKDTDTEMKVTFVHVLQCIVDACDCSHDTQWIVIGVIELLKEGIECSILARLCISKWSQSGSTVIRSLEEMLTEKENERVALEQMDPCHQLISDIILSLQAHVTHVDLDCY